MRYSFNDSFITNLLLRLAVKRILEKAQHSVRLWARVDYNGVFWLKWPTARFFAPSSSISPGSRMCELYSADCLLMFQL